VEDKQTKIKNSYKHAYIHTLEIIVAAAGIKQITYLTRGSALYTLHIIRERRYIIYELRCIMCSSLEMAVFTPRRTKTLNRSKPLIGAIYCY
jgi:hypothetical protein